MWCKNEDYWTLYFDLIEGIRDMFAENGIFVLCKQVDTLMSLSLMGRQTIARTIQDH